MISPLLGDKADPVSAGVTLRDLAEDSSAHAVALLEALAAARDEVAASDPAILGGLLRLIHMKALKAADESLPKLSSADVASVLEELPPGTPNQHLLMHLLAMKRSRDSLTTLVESLAECPLSNWVEAGQVLSPLMQYPDWPIDAVFPGMLDTLTQPPLAAAVLDLANYLVRSGRTGKHPAADRQAMLNHLLGEITQRLARFEEDPHTFGNDVSTVQSRLGEAVALAVALCDSLALIGDTSSISKLTQTVELRHRRVQCEAAGALARLGDESGRQRLLELSSDPAARLRAVQYADELGFGSEVDQQYRSASATAEAEMSLWLSQPPQMGVPPTHVEMVESRRLLWPSFHNPLDVRLVRFEYNFGDRQYSNVGITGPVVFSLSADVADLPNDDIYAIYAGWHAEHPEIFTVRAEQFNDAQRRMTQPLRDHLDRAGYESIQPELLGFFLDEHAAVFRAYRDGTECRVCTDGLETLDQAIAGRARPLEAVDLFNLYKGRKMLRTFNA